MSTPPAGWRQIQEVRDGVQFRLAMVSLGVWLLVAFTIVIVLGLAPEVRAPRVLSAGFIALAFAALPWIRYPQLVASALHRAGLSETPAAPTEAPSPR